MIERMDEDALRLLKVVLRRAGDGFSLMSSSGLDAERYSRAVRSLENNSLVSIKGPTSEDQLADAYVYVPPQAKSRGDFILRSQLSGY